MNQLPDEPFALIVGTGNAALGEALARELHVAPSRCDIGRFPDGEVSVTLHETVRGRDVFILQPTSPPVDENLIELLALVDVARRASAARVIAVTPYFGYARSDKRRHPGEPIMASAAARALEGAGVDHLIAFDLHAAQIEGFFRIPVDSLNAAPILCEALRGSLPPESVIVSPDEGGVKTATVYARLLGAPVAVVRKERLSGTETHSTDVAGDVRGRACVIVDDMISTGGTIEGAIEALRAAGGRQEIFVAATHGLLLSGAVERLCHEAVREVFLSDTIHIRQHSPQLRVVSVAPLLAETIRGIALPPANGGCLKDLNRNGRASHVWGD